MGRHRVSRSSTSARIDGNNRRGRGRNEGGLKNDFVFFQVIPDSTVNNDRVEVFTRTLGSLYEPILSRIRRLSPQVSLSWETNIEKDNVFFVMATPREWMGVVGKQLSTTWPNATVRLIPDPIRRFEPSVAGILQLRDHFMFSIRVDRRTLDPLSSILETLQLMNKDERAYIQVVFSPAPPDWWEGAAQGYEMFKKGQTPRRIQLDSPGVARYLLRSIGGLIFEGISITQELFGFNDESIDLGDVDRAKMLREGPSKRSTLTKIRDDAFEVTIRIAVESSEREAKIIFRSLAMAFRELDGDNSLVSKMVHPNVLMKGMRSRSIGLKINHDYLSVSELSRLFLLPTSHLQELYNIKSINNRQSPIPKVITSGGMLLGEAVYRNEKYKVYRPTTNADELCLPTCAIGQMGSGKTTFGANMAIEAYRNDFIAVIIDPARGEIGDMIRKAVPEDDFVRLVFGKRVVSLEWREVKHGPRGRNRFANELVSFFDTATDDAGPQTVRHLRSAAKVVPNGRLSEIVKLMTDSRYREQVIETIESPVDRTTWLAYHEYSDARQAQIASPVFNRLDAIMGDDYMTECMESTDGIDFVELLSGGPKVLVLDLPKENLGSDAVDIIASFLSTKLNLAMLLRRSKRPVFIIQDEPHQYIQSSRVWKSAAVESRKYRFAYVWMFHAWEQINRDVAAIIQAAGPHYHLFASSKATYRALAEEIKPFTVEEAMQIPRFHAINVIRAGGRVVTPFMAKMAPPPK